MMLLAMLIEAACFVTAGWLLRSIFDSRRLQLWRQTELHAEWTRGYSVGFRHAILGKQSDPDGVFLKAAGVRLDGADGGQESQR